MGTPYNMTFACLECCKSFKREYKLIPKEYPNELSCPNCGGIAFNLGRNFKAPKKTDREQWNKIGFLIENGFRFQKIRNGPGHHDAVPYPETLEAAREFVIRYKEYAIKAWHVYNKTLKYVPQVLLAPPDAFCAPLS